MTEYNTVPVNKDCESGNYKFTDSLDKEQVSFNSLNKLYLE
jgi:hypothetical protein